MKSFALLCINASLLFATPSTTAFGQPLKLVPIQSVPDNDGVVYYRSAGGRIIGFKPEILVGFENTEALHTLQEQYKPVSTEQLSPSIFLLTFPAGTDVLTLSETIGKNVHVRFAQPNIRTGKQQR